jgi:flagellar basal body-associated protein FliL
MTSKDASANNRSESDKSLQLLLILFLVTASIAASSIAIAYTGFGRQFMEQVETTITEQTSSPSLIEKEEEIIEDVPTTIGKGKSDFTEYIDRLLAQSS